MLGPNNFWYIQTDFFDSKENARGSPWVTFCASKNVSFGLSSHDVISSGNYIKIQTAAILHSQINETVLKELYEWTELM